MMIRLSPDVAEALLKLKEYELEPINDVLRRLIGKGRKKENEAKDTKPKKTQPVDTASELWDVWVDAYRQRYGVDYPRNAKNNSLIKKLQDKIGVENAKRVIPFYLQALDPWLVSRQHQLEFLVKDAEAWVTREANNQRLVSRSKIAAYDSTVSWAEVANRVAQEIGGE